MRFAIHSPKLEEVYAPYSARRQAEASHASVQFLKNRHKRAITMTEKHLKFTSSKENKSNAQKVENASSDNDLCQILINLEERKSQIRRNIYESSLLSII